jgi:nitroreductase
MKVILDRHSVRHFGTGPLPADDLDQLLAAAEAAPSSCDRRGVTVRVITGRDEKALLGGILVGGVGWIHRAAAILMLFADPSAYGAPGELDDIDMPKLDAGFLGENILLAASALGLAACYCNPNIRQINRSHFKDVFQTDTPDAIFCGAVAVGQPNTE